PEAAPPQWTDPRPSTPRSTPARDTLEPTAIRPSSAFHSLLPRREGLPRTPGPPAPHSRAGLLAHGCRRRRRPDGALRVVDSSSSRALDAGRPQWRPMEDVEPARFLGPLRSQWRDRAGLSPASLLGPTWAPGGKRCLTQRLAATQASCNALQLCR